MRPLEFGWYLPTHGDTTAYGLMEAQIPGSPELCERVVKAAERAGFEYLLIPVGATCWEAWMAGAFMAARSQKIKPLIAARPGYINPVLMANDFDLRPDVGRANLHQPDCRPERKRGRGRRRALRQGRALRADGGGGLDPQSAVDHAGSAAFPRQVPHAWWCARPPQAAAKAVSKILSRRRLAPGLGNVGEAFGRASVLGRSP